MSEFSEKRRGGDRRRFARGGRRPTDMEGFTPLVFVVDPRPTGREASEVILAKLKFAVAPFDSVEHAKRALDGLRPDLVLVAPEHLEEMRRAVPVGRNDLPLPVLPLPAGEISVDSLIDEVRRALRAGLTSS
jgi:hypothetical protein